METKRHVYKYASDEKYGRNKCPEKDNDQAAK